MGLSIGSLLVAAAACAYAVYETWVGYQFFKMSGFSFFLISGIWTGIPFILVAVILLLFPDRSFNGWEFGILVIWLAVFPWKLWQQKQARRRDPEKWARWIKKLDQSRRRQSLF